MRKYQPVTPPLGSRAGRAARLARRFSDRLTVAAFSTHSSGGTIHGSFSRFSLGIARPTPARAGLSAADAAPALPGPRDRPAAALEQARGAVTRLS
jgi:hypothetical protein